MNARRGALTVTDSRGKSAGELLTLGFGMTERAGAMHNGERHAGFKTCAQGRDAQLQVRIIQSRLSSTLDRDGGAAQFHNEGRCHSTTNGAETCDRLLAPALVLAPKADSERSEGWGTSAHSSRFFDEPTEIRPPRGRAEPRGESAKKGK